jgi:hypothetical protein
VVSRYLEAALPFAWTLLPMYLFERAANYYFLMGSQTFYLYSGWRLEVFIMAALVGSLAAGFLLRDLKLVLAAQLASIASFFTLVYAFCDPRVCYSAAPDGLEPLRFFLFLGSVAAASGSLGVGLGAKGNRPGWEAASAAIAGFFAVGYYPVVFTFAGARLLAPYYPWGAATALFALSLFTSVSAARTLSQRRAFFLPLAGLLALLAACEGVGAAYLFTLWPDILAFAVATLVGASFALWGARTGPLRRGAPLSFAAALVLVLSMTVVVIPDAVSGVAPIGGQSQFASPAYAGAYQAAPQGHAYGAMVNVSFSGTDPAVIQRDNFLAAGMGIHSAGCCVDGIDYSYRFDLYLTHGGKMEAVATGWEACDDNAACGGHSWKLLLLERVSPISNGSSTVLMMQWQGGTIDWSYRQGSGPPVNFTSYTAPAPENHDFNTGVSAGVSYSEQKAAYFYQFGIMSSYPIGKGGWGVTMRCPSLLWNGSWNCVSHVGTLQGVDAYWKVIWRWGESYPDVSISSPNAGTIDFGYSPPGTRSFSTLW